MTLKEAAIQAVRQQDAQQVMDITKQLRFRHCLDYVGVLSFFKRTTGIGQAGYEELLKEADDE